MSEPRLRRFLHVIQRPWFLLPALFLLFVFLAFTALVVQRQRRIAEVPDVGEPFDLDAHAFVDIPDDENAFILYRQATHRLRELHEIIGTGRQEYETASDNLNAALEEGWHVAEDDIRKWVEQNREAMEIWLAGTERPNAVEIQPGDFDLETFQPITQELRDFSRLALLEASRLLEDGEHAAAWKWYRAVLRSSRHAGMNTNFIGRFVGTALHAMAHDGIVRWAAEPQVKTELLRHALRDVTEIYEMTPPPSVALKTGYFVGLNMISLLLDEAGIISRTVSDLRGETIRGRRLVKLFYANWLSQIDRPLHERTSTASVEIFLFALDLRDRADPKLYPPEDIERWAMQNTSGILLALLSPAIDQYDEAITREQTRQAALVLTIALQIFHREHGEFPDNLESLVPAILPKLPIDPYGGGEPLRYRREANVDHAALLWSVAGDGVDQDGKVDWEFRADEPGDWIFKIYEPGTKPAKETATPQE